LAKLSDDRGNRMTPSYAIKKGVRYRYYVSCVLAQGRKDEAGSVSRIAATAIEALVVNAIARGNAQDNERNEAQAQNGDLIERVVTSRQKVEIRLVREAMNADHPSDTITVAWTPETFRR